MLSPGQWHKQVPKDPLANLAYRSRLVRAIRDGGRVARAAIRHMCATDILFYVNSFVWQYNPNLKDRSASKIGPFILYDFQEEAIVRQGPPGKEGILWCIEHGEDFVVEKSREMGATWIFLIVMDWLCRFDKNHKSLVMSRDSDAVEKNEPDSLFWKIDFMHRYLPEWLRGKVDKTKGRISYEDSGSYCTGEASTGDAGVGGRAFEMFIDEFSKIKEAREVYSNTADTTSCRMFNGTHYGVGTVFHDLCKNPYVRKIQFHWSQHPDKNRGLYRSGPKIEVIDKTYPFPEDFQYVMDGSPTGGPFPGLRSPWYDDQCRRRQRQDVAMHLDIDPQGSTSQFFDSLTIHRLIAENACDPYWTGRLDYDRDSGRPLELVEDEQGDLKLWLNLDHNGLPPTGRYALTADVALGSGGASSSPSCLAGVNCLTGEKILEFSSATTPPTVFAELAVALCWLFKTESGAGALLNWEANGVGAAFGKRVQELNYGNTGMRETKPQVLNGKTSEIPGWWSTPVTKKALLIEYKTALERGHFLNHSKEALLECLNFKNTDTGAVEHGSERNPDPSATRENHGDLVIADALAYKMAKYQGMMTTVKKPVERREEAHIGTLEGRREWWRQRAREEAAWG